MKLPHTQRCLAETHPTVESNSSAEGLIRMPEVRQLVQLSRSAIERLVRSDVGDFPKPIRLTPTKIAWRRDEIIEWIKNRERVR